MLPAKISLRIAPLVRRSSWTPQYADPVRRALELWTLLSCEYARIFDEPLPAWVDENWFEHGKSTHTRRMSAFRTSERIAGYLSKEGERIKVSICFYHKGERRPFFSQTFYIEKDGRLNPGFSETGDA